MLFPPFIADNCESGWVCTPTIGTFWKIRAAFAGRFHAGGSELSREIFFGKLATASTYTPSFQQVARQEPHVGFDALARDLLVLGKNHSNSSQNSYDPNPDRLLPDSMVFCNLVPQLA